MGNNETDPNTFGSYVGSEPNNYNAYADINRNGTVDYSDLSIFSGEWLYNADDPNTYSKLTPKVDGMSVLDSRHLRDFQRDAAERLYGREKLVYGKEEREAA